MRVFLCMAAVVWVVVGQVPAPKIERPAPEQPLPFNHKKHVSQGLKCQMCHPMPGDGEMATIVPPAVCMGCHAQIKKDSPHIQKLTEFYKEGKKLPWAKVYRVPDYVFFNHKAHVSAEGVTCETCHGPVGEREVLRREKDLSMQSCMDCHRAKNAKTDCTFCHEQR